MGVAKRCYRKGLRGKCGRGDGRGNYFSIGTKLIRASQPPRCPRAILRPFARSRTRQLAMSSQRPAIASRKLLEVQSQSKTGQIRAIENQHYAFMIELEGAGFGAAHEVMLAAERLPCSLPLACCFAPRRHAATCATDATWCMQYWRLWGGESGAQGGANTETVLAQVLWRLDN